MPDRRAARTRAGCRIAIVPLTARWNRVWPSGARIARRAARAALSDRTGASPVAATVALANDRQVRRLNADFRGIDRPTNVLSFPAAAARGSACRTSATYLGDVILALETIRREARAQSKAPEDHLAHLVVHGVLHLLGYDHERSRAAAAMEALEVKILKTLGISNPYAVVLRTAG